MSSITKAWKNARICYQLRYALYAKQHKENPEDREVLGHLHECSYVLIEIFGLSAKQVQELELNDFCGLTNQDFNRNRPE